MTIPLFLSVIVVGIYLKLVDAALTLPALNAVGIPVLDCGAVYSSTLPRLGIGLGCEEGACVLFL